MQTSSHHRPFAEVQASRPRFEAVAFVDEQQPDTDWQPGQGLNKRDDLPDRAAFAACDPAAFTTLQPTAMSSSDMFKLMIGAVVPRPIALCSTIGADGTEITTPWSATIRRRSCFRSRPSEVKDSCRHIRDTGEFVVHAVSEHFVEAANITMVDAPAGVSEWDLSGLTRVPSTIVRPPRVAESPFAAECTLEHEHEVRTDDGKLSAVVMFGRVRLFHVRSDLLDHGAVDIAKLAPVGRVGGISYSRTNRTFEVDKAQWSELKDWRA